MLNGNTLVLYICSALAIFLASKPMEIIVQANYTVCRDKTNSTECRRQANEGHCSYLFVKQNCKKTCNLCPTTLPPTQKPKTLTVTPYNNSTTPTSLDTTTSTANNNYTNNTFTHSGSLCESAPTLLMAAVLLWLFWI